MRSPLASAAAAIALAAAATTASAQRAAGPAAPSASPDAFVLPATPPPAIIAPAEYATRRAALARQMGDGVLVVLGEDEPDADYLPFAQTPPMRYLAGVTEPGAVLLIGKRGGTVRELLFVRPRNPSREVWEGARLGAEVASRLTGIPARESRGMMAALDSMLAGGGTLYTVSPTSMDGGGSAFKGPEQQFAEAVLARHPGTRTQALAREMMALRASKSPAELDQIRRAAYITALAQRQAMMNVRPAMNEFEILGLIEGTFRRYGAERPSFGTIVGSGPNSTTLHYRTADRFMQSGEVLVMDIGASYRGYAADLTRTVPVNGRFTPEQRAIYEIVLDAQKQSEQRARPGGNLFELQEVATRVIANGLARLGLIESPEATYDCGAKEQPRPCPQVNLYFMHGLGHGIGLDVHDPDPSYPPFGGKFTRGSAFTIEPGIYVRADLLDYLPDTPANRATIAKLRPVVQRYRNIGVRIEDDYFITDTGVERVTAGAPREIAEIEALMAREGTWNRERRPEVVEWYRAGQP